MLENLGQKYLQKFFWTFKCSSSNDSRFWDTLYIVVFTYTGFMLHRYLCQWLLIWLNDVFLFPAGKGKGTPMLRNGIRLIERLPDPDESDVNSDWQGFGWKINISYYSACIFSVRFLLINIRIISKGKWTKVYRKSFLDDELFASS